MSQEKDSDHLFTFKVRGNVLVPIETPESKPRRLSPGLRSQVIDRIREKKARGECTYALECMLQA